MSVEYLVRWMTTLGGLNAAETEKWLNDMAANGWRLIAVDGGRGYFERVSGSKDYKKGSDG